jgi:hypothetical protein
MDIIYTFGRYSPDGILIDGINLKEIDEDANWFHSREEAITWLKAQDREVFDGLALILLEYFMP